MTPDNLASSIVRHLTGELSEREEIELLRALENDPERRQLYEELREMWEHSELPRHPWDPNTALERIKRRQNVRPPFHVLPRRPAWAPLRIAAGIALLLGAGTLWRVAGVSTFLRKAAHPTVREFSTPRGQRATVQLADGTRLILAAESRLRVPNDYGRHNREVYLEGEALFDVVHDASRPFRVLAKGAVAEDIGTRFDVRAYAEDSVVAVAVAEGAVALGGAEAPGAGSGRSGRRVPQGIVLRRGELGTLASDGRVTTATGTIINAYFAWTEGRLLFFRTSLADAARTLGRWGDIDVRIGDRALAAMPITAEFGVQSAKEMLQELALAANANLIWSGKAVTLQPKP